MPCYYPITAYRSRSGRSSNGKWPIVFKRKEGYYDLEVKIPCGQCIGCRLEKSRQWAMRCVDESKMFADNCFVTLTYSDENLPANGSLVKRDLQLLWKRMRKSGIKFRYYASGEYGDASGRPHYHACIFGWRPDRFTQGKEPDKCMHAVGKCDVCNAIRTREVPLYHCKELDKLWEKGIVIIGEVTFESAAYIARYVMKKMSGEKSNLYYGKRIREFGAMSRRPGIGKEYYERYKESLYPRDKAVIRGGTECKPAIYYDRLYDVENPEKMHKIRYRRERNGFKNRSENTWERLKVKEEIKKIKIERCKRVL